MIRPKLLLVADTIITDKDSNNASAINILEEISVPTLPVIIPKLSILSIFDRDETDPEEFETTYRITMHGQIIFEQIINSNFQGRPRFRQTLVMGGLPVTQAGIIDIVVIRDNEVRLTYQITIKPPPTQTPTVLSSTS